MEDARIRKFARYLIGHAVELQRGEKILIELHGRETTLAKALVEETYLAGGKPYFQMYDYAIEGALITGADEEHMRETTALALDRMRKMDAYIDIRATENVNVWNRVPADRMANYRKEYWGPLHLDERCNHTRWSVMRYPNDAMAQLAGMSTEEYEDFYFKACLLDYERMSIAMKPLAALMDRTDRVRITGHDTDLTFSIKGMGSHPSGGHSNLPDGEVYTAPLMTSVNGYIHYNAPSPYDGFVYSDIRLEFRDGKIVNATANNSERINQIFDTDAGARYVGEFAIGVNPVITSPMLDILFDEKIAGSFHFTPGNSYDNCSNGNHSSVHWDLVNIQTPEYGGGEIYFDDVLIRKDGRFVLDELLPLNPENLL